MPFNTADKQKSFMIIVSNGSPYSESRKAARSFF
jgi:hypothetical protein